MESDLLTTHCPNEGIQNICQKLKLLTGPLPQNNSWFFQDRYLPTRVRVRHNSHQATFNNLMAFCLYKPLTPSISHSFSLVAECKFLCPTHSEAKQTKTLEFGAEKGLLQGQAKRMGGLCSKTPKSLMFLEEKFFPFFFLLNFLFYIGV